MYLHQNILVRFNESILPFFLFLTNRTHPEISINNAENYIIMMVEIFFEFRCSETVQKKFHKYLRILSPWLKKILNSTVLKCFKMKDFHRYLRKYRILSPWLKCINRAWTSPLKTEGIEGEGG